MDITKTSRTKTFSKGFTLLEVMVVLGIMSAILAIGLPRMNFKNDNIKTVVRKMSVLTREIRNQARLKNRTYRLVMSISSDTKKASSYWIEYADGPQLAPSQVTLDKNKFDIVDTDKSAPNPFKKDEKLMKEPTELPKALTFAQIEKAGLNDPITSGEASIYFSPEGIVERSAIEITDRKNVTWTLVLNPLTGHADAVEKAVHLKDLSKE